MADYIRIKLFTTIPLRSGPGLTGMLDAFESVSECRPTHWGREERIQNPYDRQAVMDTVSSFTEEFFTPTLQRRKPPRYEASFTARNAGMKHVSLAFTNGLPDGDMPLAFDLAGALAERLEPAYGFVHPMWDESGELSKSYIASGTFKSPSFNRCGPRALYARTWLGPHLVHLVGRELLTACGCLVNDTAWGGLQVDLVERPEKATFDVLSVRQAEVMKRLQPSGVFGDYSNAARCKPGPKWAPVPT
jgi:hypothetical protein